MTDLEARALGALTGLALGDALGMPTQSLPRELILARYGPIIDGFHPAPTHHPIAAGLPAGSVTDDTEQALLLAHLLIDGDGHIDPAELGRRLLAWEDDMRGRGSRDLLGPSTRIAIANLQAGMDPAHTGRTGTTNGAAMRITPVGIAVAVQPVVDEPVDVQPVDVQPVARAGEPAAEPTTPATPADLMRLVDRVTEASSLTHHTGLALAGAAAIAAAVSAGLSGAAPDSMVQTAVAAAELGQARGHWVAGAAVGPRIRWAVDLVARAADAELIDTLYRLVGTSLASQESIPAACAAFAARADDPWLACRIAASLGGDTDTIAAMVGAMCGAVHGVAAFPEAAVDELRTINRLDLTPIVTGLLALRRTPTANPLR